jgi:hypothetical protein
MLPEAHSVLSSACAGGAGRGGAVGALRGGLRGGRAGGRAGMQRVGRGLGGRGARPTRRPDDW